MLQFCLNNTSTKVKHHDDDLNGGAQVKYARFYTNRILHVENFLDHLEKRQHWRQTGTDNTSTAFIVFIIRACHAYASPLEINSEKEKRK